MIMALISSFTTDEKKSNYSQKFSFYLTPTNYGYWRKMIHSFLLEHKLFDYMADTIPGAPKQLPHVVATTADPKPEPRDNPNYSIWITSDAHILMLIISTLYESAFRHVQGDTSYDMWSSLECAFALHSYSREYTLKTQLLRTKMKGDETPNAYLNRA
uniref:Retrotransposon Copia-like N-terminal domain-containing protein n=1 Tax=Lactuca sativa TaxID=4236 RepID=A0A9R1VJA2_LACSA|nr:hypothetical protein LSAT_V11C500252410 [Lactuca sativa]